MTWNAIVASSTWDTLTAAKTMLENGSATWWWSTASSRWHPVHPRPHGRAPGDLPPDPPAEMKAAPATGEGISPRRLRLAHRAGGEELGRELLARANHSSNGDAVADVVLPLPRIWR